jgi:poly [ADP-ribose] polymerase
MSDVVMDRKFVCTASDRNNNKFWNVKVYSDGRLETVYGRVGDSGASTLKNFGTEAEAIRQAEKMITKKEKGKPKGGTRVSVYKEIEIVGTVGSKVNNTKSVGKDTFKKIANGDSAVEKLIAFLDKQNIHNITNNTNITYDETTGLFSTPLGVVGQTCIDDARNVLSKIKTHVGKSNKTGDKLAEEFMMLIPQDIGRRRPTLSAICPNMNKFDELNSILDSLQGSLDILNSSDNDDDDDNEELDFGVLVSQITTKKVIDKIKKLYGKTRKSQHVCYHLDVDKVWGVEHKAMNAAYETKKKLGNIQQLWHGTRVGNVLSILAKGMYIPPSSASHCTGRMFGDGLYFSDQSTKSLNYAYGYWSGTKSNHCFMFLFDVIMGKSYTPSSYGGRLPKSGYDSTFAKAGESGVMNNEMIVYNAAQCRPVYLVEFKG